MRAYKFVLPAVLLITTALTVALAAERTSLKRSEVRQIKNKLVAVLNALGNSPPGYVKEDESFNLPSDTYTVRKTAKFRPAFASVSRKFVGDSGKLGASKEVLEKEMQAKINAAMGRGDFASIQGLTMEYRQKMMAVQSARDKARKLVPIELRVRSNVTTSTKIDPDGVLFESPGVIALKFKRNRRGQSKVEVYFDPVSLKNTEELSKLVFRHPREGVGRKSIVLNFRITVTGPPNLIEAWAKKFDTKAILRQIDGG